MNIESIQGKIKESSLEQFAIEKRMGAATKLFEASVLEEMSDQSNFYRNQLHALTDTHLDILSTILSLNMLLMRN